MQVLVFSARDDADDGARRAERLCEAIKPVGIPITHHRKFGSIDDLLALAGHKIVQTPCVVVVDGRREVARMLGLPGVLELQAILRRLA